MELYLMRHGIAEDGEPGTQDSERRLTPEGKTRAAAILKLARRTGVKPDLILSSPYLRALQTARIAQQELSVAESILEFPALVPYGSPEDTWKQLRDYAQFSSLLLTGHEPQISHLIAYLLNSPALLVEVKKAAIIRIDLVSTGATPRGVLRWMLVPAMVD